MLDKNTIKKETFELLKKLMTDSMFEGFFLVGGTSIALQLGHRKSIDLDLFTQNDINVSEFNNYLAQQYGFIERYRGKNTLKGDINGVFIDCIKYDYPLIKPLIIENNIRAASLEDVCAMKLSAITDDGTRLKDFVDISYLSTRFSLNYMLSQYSKKFQGSNIISPVKALQYFDEIDFNGEPVELCNAKFNWENIKNRIVNMIKEPDKKFKSYPILKQESIDYYRER